MRETATNLAAAEIDRIQSLPDPFTVVLRRRPPSDRGRRRLLQRHDVTSSGSPRRHASGACGSGGGNLQYKQVNVTVTWPNMYLTEPVHADSALAPVESHQRPELRRRAGLRARHRRRRALRRDRARHARERRRRADDHRHDRQRPTSTAAPTCSRSPPGKYNDRRSRRPDTSTPNQIAVPSYTQQVIAAGTTTTASFQYENCAALSRSMYAANVEREHPQPPVEPRDHLRRRPRQLPQDGHGHVAQAASVSRPAIWVCPDNPADLRCNVDPEAWTENSTMADARPRPPLWPPARGTSANLGDPDGRRQRDDPERQQPALHHGRAAGDNGILWQPRMRRPPRPTPSAPSSRRTPPCRSRCRTAATRSTPATRSERPRAGT